MALVLKLWTSAELLVNKGNLEVSLVNLTCYDYQFLHQTVHCELLTKLFPDGKNTLNQMRDKYKHLEENESGLNLTDLVLLSTHNL